MNKRAKKRLIESIRKEKEAKAKTAQVENLTPSKDVQQLRGYLPKPAKKRG